MPLGPELHARTPVTFTGVVGARQTPPNDGGRCILGRRRELPPRSRRSSAARVSPVLIGVAEAQQELAAGVVVEAHPVGAVVELVLELVGEVDPLERELQVVVP